MPRLRSCTECKHRSRRKPGVRQARAKTACDPCGWRIGFGPKWRSWRRLSGGQYQCRSRYYSMKRSPLGKRGRNNFCRWIAAEDGLLFAANRYRLSKSPCAAVSSAPVRDCDARQGRAERQTAAGVYLRKPRYRFTPSPKVNRCRIEHPKCYGPVEPGAK